MLIRYVTKQEVLQVIREWKTGRKEDLEMAVKSIKVVPVARSRKLGLIHIESDEEWCPHCYKKLPFYDAVNQSPKYCYCLWCGGAIKRLKGNRNGRFDYRLLKDEPEFDDAWLKRPSIKQIQFAMAIRKRTKIPLPEECTAETYGKYIRDNKSAYYFGEVK